MRGQRVQFTRQLATIIPLGAVLLVAFGMAVASDAASKPVVWMGPSGEPLPFKTYAEIEDFLRTAEIVEMEDIPVGVTHPRKVLLEKDGIQAKACFRDVDIFERKAILPNKGVKKNWRDCCMFEVAAYRLSNLLGLDNIPPVVIRKIKDTDGTLQIWLENSTMETDRAKKSINPPNAWRHKMQWQVMRVFDALIYNDDRNAGNILYDADWKVWMIDHTRSFQRISELPKPNQIRHCEKDLWAKLQKLDEEDVKEMIGEYVKSAELKALFKRHDKLVAYIEDEIAKRGEKQVIFSFY